MKKKLVALVLIGSMALSFTACGNSSDSSKGTKGFRGLCKGFIVIKKNEKRNQ